VIVRTWGAGILRPYKDKKPRPYKIAEAGIVRLVAAGAQLFSGAEENPHEEP
jgi:hypothetical protein